MFLSGDYFIWKTVVSQQDNRDALSKVKFSRENIQKQPKQPSRQIFQQKKPDYEYHSEPLRQHLRFVEGVDFEEKDSETSVERTEKLIQLFNNISIQNFTFVLFFYSLYKFFFSVSIKRGFLINFLEDIFVHLSKNAIERSFISSQKLNHLISNIRFKY